MSEKSSPSEPRKTIMLREVWLLPDSNSYMVVDFPEQMSAEDFRDACEHLDLLRRKLERRASLQDEPTPLEGPGEEGPDA